MLKSRLQDDQVTSLRAGHKDRLSTIRYILAQIKNKEIEKQQELTDEEVLTVLRKFVKELHDSISMAQKANRDDLLNQSKEQLAIVSEFLPAELSDEQLTQKIETVIEENSQLFETNPGALIGVVVSKLKNEVDPSRIAPIVQKLTNK